jgi:hypothetical protein
MIDPTPIALKPDDAPDEQPTHEGELSALAEAQVLELIGKFAGIRTVLLRLFERPDHRLNPDQARAVRIALGYANEGVLIAQAVTMSTVRRRR